MAGVVVDEERLTSKLRWNVIPFVFLLYVIAILDRVNVGVAALTMNKDLGISATVFGTISGIFFISYFIFEIPSNAILYRVGARIWIARIMITWGLVTVFQGLARGAMDIGILRFLLGAAEAGFFPGIVLYLTFWFPARSYARAITLFATAVAIANIIGAPVSGWIVGNGGWLGLVGWRWVFILEGIPAVILGVVTLFVLVDRPQKAKFLSEDEKKWLAARLAAEHEARLKVVRVSEWGALKNGWLWYFAVCYFGFVFGLYALVFWMPQIVKGLSSSFSTTQIGFITAIPYICAVISMVLVANHSDKVMERRLHAGIPLIVAAVAALGLTMTENVVLSIILLSVATMGIYTFLATFWTLPTAILGEAAAAVGIALINSVGNLGGFVGPFVIGFLADRTHTMSAGMYALAAILLIAGILTMAVPKKHEEAVAKAPAVEPTT